MNKRIPYLYFLGLLLVLLGSASGVSAQRVLTLEEAIATALANNYQIQLSKNDSVIAAIDYSYRNAVFMPTVNSSMGTTWNKSKQQQVLIDTTRKSGVNSNNIQGNIGLNWVLFDGFKMFATRDKTEAMLRAGSLEVRNQIINTIAEVINNYYGIARQEQLVEATEVQIRLNEERAKLAQYKLDIGTGAKPDVLQSKVDLNEQRALKMQQQTGIEQLKAQLLQAMNSRIQPYEFEIPDTIPVNYELNIGDLQQDIERINPSLLLARTNIDIAQYTLKETKAGQYPTVSFISNYNYNRNQNNIALTRFSPLFSQSNGFNYGFTAAIPIFNQFRVKKQIQKDQQQLNYRQLVFESQRSLLNLSINNAFREYEQQKKQLKLEEENILLARENVDIVFQTYKLGMATLVQLRQAQLSYAQANDRLIAARYNAKLSETELMRLRGDIVK